MPTDTVLYELDGGVATITLNDPSTRNALSPELLGGLVEAFERARDDADDERQERKAFAHRRGMLGGPNLPHKASARATPTRCRCPPES